MTVMVWPKEYQLDYHMNGNTMRNQAYYAGSIGHDVGRQVSDVILKCLNGELAEYEKASLR